MKTPKKLITIYTNVPLFFKKSNFILNDCTFQYKQMLSSDINYNMNFDKINLDTKELIINPYLRLDMILHHICRLTFIRANKKQGIIFFSKRRFQYSTHDKNRDIFFIKFYTNYTSIKDI